MADKIKQKRGTLATWLAVEPILDSGEIGYVTDTNEMVIGDGTNQFSGLPRFSANLASDTVNGLMSKEDKMDLTNLGNYNVSIPTDLKKIGVVLDVGGAGEWDENMVESPAIFYDKHKQKYGMVYVGYNTSGIAAIGLAWSNDLINWEKDINNPIFGGSGVTGSSDEVGTTGPLIYIEDNIYYLFYIGLTGIGYEAGVKTLNLAHSTDLYNWVRNNNNPIIEPDPNIPWRDTAIWHPSVVKDNGKYYLFFNASGSLDVIEKIGYAVSEDLYNWTVDDLNSPIIESGGAGEWDENRQGDPSVFKMGDTWFMNYYGLNSNNEGQDGLAFTGEKDFPLNWKKFENNPTLPVGNTFSIDSQHAHKPFVYINNNNIFHYYTAVNQANYRRIALAINNYKYNTIQIHSNEETRVVTNTVYSGLANSTFINSYTQGFIRFILMAKVDTLGTTLDVRFNGVSSSPVVSVNSTSWQPYISDYVSLEYFNDVVQRLDAKVNANSASVGNIVYEILTI